MATTYMNLTLTTVSVTAGPTYGTQIGTAITTIDSHDHTSGKGTRVPTAGITVDATLAMNGVGLSTAKSVAFTAQAVALTDTYRIWAKTDGNLWYTNSSGTPVQITSGGTLNTAALITSVYTQLALAGNLVIGASDTYTHYLVSSAAARAITLPAASAVTAGRFYNFSDSTGGAATYNITISRAGADTIEGATSYVINTAYETVMLVSDGTSKWTAVSHAASTTKKGAIVLAGDLGGTASAPTVVALTGASNKITLASGCATIEFNAATSTPATGRSRACTRKTIRQPP
jgi:hypothetical protein